MKPPRLNRLLKLEAQVRTADGAGGFVETWTELGELWAEVSPRTGRERAESGQQVSSVAYKIVVRATPQGWASRPLPEQRLRDGARAFVIKAVTEFDHDARYLTCFAEEEIAP